MRALGADVVLEPSDRLQITEELIRRMIARADSIARDEGAWWVDQLNNEDGARGYERMGDELWTQAGGQVDAFVQSVGTAHSLHGAVAALRRHRPDIYTVAVEPAESPVLSAGTTGGHRIEGIGIGFVPPLWHRSDATEIATVSSDEAQEMTRRLAREEGLFVGSSSGANVVAALRVAERLGPGATVGTVLLRLGHQVPLHRGLQHVGQPSVIARRQGCADPKAWPNRPTRNQATAATLQVMTVRWSDFRSTPSSPHRVRPRRWPAPPAAAGSPGTWVDTGTRTPARLSGRSTAPPPAQREETSTTASRASPTRSTSTRTPSDSRSGTWRSRRRSGPTPSRRPPPRSRMAAMSWRRPASSGSASGRRCSSPRTATSGDWRQRWPASTPRPKQRWSGRHASRRRPRHAPTSSLYRTVGQDLGRRTQRNRRGDLRADRRPGGDRLHVHADRPREAHGWDAAFGAGVLRLDWCQGGRGKTPGPGTVSGTDLLSVKEGRSGRGERHSPATTDLPITMRLAEPPEPFDWLRSA